MSSVSAREFSLQAELSMSLTRMMRMSQKGNGKVSLADASIVRRLTFLLGTQGCFSQTVHMFLLDCITRLVASLSLWYLYPPSGYAPGHWLACHTPQTFGYLPPSDWRDVSSSDSVIRLSTGDGVISAPVIVRCERKRTVQYSGRYLTNSISPR